MKKIKLALIKIKLIVFKLYWYLIRIIKKPSLPANADGKVYVNLGCGVHTSKEFINIDTVHLPHIHYINDIVDLFMLADNSVDLIYASHVIEHIPRSRLIKSLKEWYRVLKPGGVLRFGVPDFDRLIEVYQASNKEVGSIINQLMGSEGEYDAHHSIWNSEYAQALLKKIGFREVREWNYENAEHHDFKDKTSRIMKAGDKDLLISLNLEAIK